MLAQKHQWSTAFFHASPIIVLVSGLFYYWFALVDRFIIFLYGHLGATAFNSITNGRYWMAGLVAGGIVMVLYTATNAVIGMMKAEYAPPLWWQVWLIAATPLTVIIPAIVLNLNQPTLPISLAVLVTAVILLALALALPPATIASQSILQLGWLLLAGIGIMPSLLLLRVIELPQQGLVEPATAYIIGIGSTIAGFIWSTFIGWLTIRRHQSPWTTVLLFTTSLQISYLLLPLVHYLLMTPAKYRYISSSRNFFSINPILQISVWLIALLASSGICALQRKWYLT